MLTNFLSILVTLPGPHLELEFMLRRAELQQVLAGLACVCLECMFDAIRCVLKGYLSFL